MAQTVVLSSKFTLLSSKWPEDHPKIKPPPRPGGGAAAKGFSSPSSCTCLRKILVKYKPLKEVDVAFSLEGQCLVWLLLGTSYCMETRNWGAPLSPFTCKVEHRSLQRLMNMQWSVWLHVEYDKSPHCLQIASHIWNKKEDAFSFAKWRGWSHSTRRRRITIKALHNCPLWWQDQ